MINNLYSYRICTTDQSRELDRRTIEEFGIDGFTLMETAGMQAAGIISSRFENGSTGVYVCGKGNNAGDALVIARYLSLHHSHKCIVWMVAGTEKLSPDAEKNLGLLKQLAEENPAITILTNHPDSDSMTPDYLVDGMLGTGLNDEVRSPFDEAVNWINNRNIQTYSLDIPTGLHADDGRVMGVSVNADVTLSFGFRKLGFYLGSGPELTGKVIQLSLSFPSRPDNWTATLISDQISEQLPPIERHAEHKYSNGVVYIIAGSEGLTGAAIMAARSAWKSGTGAVFLFSPRGLLPVYEKVLPEIIKIPLGNQDDTRFSSAHLETIQSTMQKRPGTLLIGPGLGRDDNTLTMVKKLMTSFYGDAVIDADALLAVKDMNAPEGASWIITPHPGEVAVISDSSKKKNSDRLTWSQEYSKKHRLYVLSKGSPTIVGTPEGKLYLTEYDTRIFSRAGFGDVLGGKTAGFLSITKISELSIIHALLDGYKRSQVKLKNDPTSSIEPADLI